MNGNALRFPGAGRPEFENSTGDLIERASDVLTAQRRLHRLLVANRRVVDGLDLDHVLRHIAEAAVTLAGAQYGALGVIDTDGHLEQLIHVKMPTEVIDQIGRLLGGHGVVDGGTPIRMEGLGVEPRSIGFPPLHPPIGSFLCVPIRIRDSPYGNLYLANRTGGVFTAEDEELVTALAATAAVAIDNARLYAQSERAGRLSLALSEVTAALLAPDAEDVFGVIAERLTSLVDADLVTIIVPDDSATEHRIETARGVGADSIGGAIVCGADSVVSYALDNGRVVSSGGGLDAPWFSEQLTGGATIAAPLVASGAPVGAVCVTRGPGGATFSTAELVMVSEFAAQAGFVIALVWARADRQRLDLVEDRARIARDLHDHVIQRLFGTGLGLQALASAAPQHAAVIDTYAAEIDAAIVDIRTVIFALQTSTAESARHRLLNVITELTAILAAPPRMTFAGPVDLMVTGLLADDMVAVVRESLINVARHAHAGTAVVEVSVTHSDVTVIVDDDGIGLPAKALRASGTANLAVRARAYGGHFTLEPRTSGGARARWCIPLPSSLGMSR
ncbi:GAF domain-containing sensor histidine kinase [Tsukamurella tyrosinosolvens]|uniref:GAF domain-containing sensor histidine kinase n=1 Tax=Tsukamurella tyrosinosolvens TaxID=57704 RepID=UPI000C7F29AF|nr:GAF domain-containing protein [Tsukamurella tyrosinosolvens]AUN41830.1 hypothetical protein ASU32_18970 [Tsukamurella tyrosinosolvens]